MKTEDGFAILLGIIFGWILGSTRFNLIAPGDQINKTNVTEAIDKTVFNCNEFDDIYIYLEERWRIRIQCIETNNFDNFSTCVASHKGYT